MEQPWEQIAAVGPGAFVTREIWRTADGAVVDLESRRRRKQSPRLNPRGPAGRRGRPAVYWAPRRVTWWVGVLFMIGSTCFAVPSVPGFASATSDSVAALVYFIGSLFFTGAGYLTYFESINAGREAGSDAPSGEPLRRLAFLSWQPRRIDFWAAGVQFVGTLFFNVNTFHALDVSLSGPAYDAAVWRPDAWGSFCFLIASYLAWAEVCHSFWRLSGRCISWWIAAVNMLGAIAFGISAIGAWQFPEHGGSLSATAANLGTLAGALCFFAAAFLLLPETARQDVPNS